MGRRWIFLMTVVGVSVLAGCRYPGAPTTGMGAYPGARVPAPATGSYGTPAATSPDDYYPGNPPPRSTVPPLGSGVGRLDEESGAADEPDLLPASLVESAEDIETAAARSMLADGPSAAPPSARVVPASASQPVAADQPPVLRLRGMPVNDATAAYDPRAPRAVPSPGPVVVADQRAQPAATVPDSLPQVRFRDAPPRAAADEEVRSASSDGSVWRARSR